METSRTTHASHFTSKDKVTKDIVLDLSKNNGRLIAYNQFDDDK